MTFTQLFLSALFMAFIPVFTGLSIFEKDNARSMAYSLLGFLTAVVFAALFEYCRQIGLMDANLTEIGKGFAIGKSIMFCFFALICLVSFCFRLYCRRRQLRE